MTGISDNGLQNLHPRFESGRRLFKSEPAWKRQRTTNPLPFKLETLRPLRSPQLSSSRTEANGSEPERTPNTPQITPSYCVVVPETLPADLRFIVDAWTDLDEPIKAAMLAMVKATKK
jgi:hypothetical protein